MIFEKFIDKDLGQVSYIIGCGEKSEAFIIDPRRDIDEYVQFLDDNNLEVKYILNTHTHADYVGGHLEIANRYQAKNVFQKDAPIKNYEIIKASQGDEFQLGSINMKVLETPGHTPFDISFLLQENGTDKAIFTGDSLFVSDIGRPDLLGEENLNLLVNLSYDSSKKLWELNDDLMVFTSHVQGSLCGKNLSQQYFSTIGIEKKTNHSFSLLSESKEAYVNNLLTQNIETPAFFKRMATLNINGVELMDNIYNEIQNIEFIEIQDKENLQLIDLRNPIEFHKQHISGAINIFEGANVSLIAGNILDYDKDIYLIGDINSDFDAFIIKLLRVGLDTIKGVVVTKIEDIDTAYLKESNTLNKADITDDVTNILLDENCSDLGVLNLSCISNVKEVDLSQFDKVIFSCKYGYKSSAVFSLFNNESCYILED